MSFDTVEVAGSSPVVPTISFLAICADQKPPGVMLFHCNSEWKALGCSAHGSVAEAKDRAEGIYP